MMPFEIEKVQNLQSNCFIALINNKSFIIANCLLKKNSFKITVKNIAQGFWNVTEDFRSVYIIGVHEIVHKLIYK